MYPANLLSCYHEGEWQIIHTVFILYYKRQKKNYYIQQLLTCFYSFTEVKIFTYLTKALYAKKICTSFIKEYILPYIIYQALFHTNKKIQTLRSDYVRDKVAACKLFFFQYVLLFVSPKPDHINTAFLSLSCTVLIIFLLNTKIYITLFMRML